MTQVDGAADQAAPIRRVLVIGAGASGLTAIKELRRSGIEVVCFEARSRVGGAWICSPDPPGPCEIRFDSDGRPFPVNAAGPPDATPLLDPSPMYPLRTNIPAEIMAYRDFPFQDISGPFPRDDEVLKYLEDYAAEAVPYITFNRLVHRVRAKGVASGNAWIVESQEVGASKDATVYLDDFDAICDCSGHYARPYIPFIQDLWKYKREIMHAKWYRTPEAFANKNVLVVGNSASGYDVGREIATFFRGTQSQNKVYQSVRHAFEIGTDPSEGPDWASHLFKVDGISHVTESDVVLKDGMRLDVDVIIFATGYLYSFPYYQARDSPFDAFPLVKTPPLPKGAEKPTDSVAAHNYPEGGLKVHNLDAEFQLFYDAAPTLALLCLNKNIIPFPLAQVQAHAVAKRWAGTDFTLAPDESKDEDPLYHKYGFPKEFDVADALLRAVGEGRPSNGLEIEEDGSFPATATWRREMRPLGKAYRKQELGY